MKELKKEDLLTVKRLVKQKAPRLEKNLEECSQVMLGLQAAEMIRCFYVS